MKKILVTGALGHIGSKFIHSLKPGEFDEVRMIDNLSTQRYASLFNLPRGVHFRFFQDDILSANLERITEGLDAVIHLAAITDALSSFERRAEVELINYQGTQRVAEACVKNGARFIFPSTTSVYGTQAEVVDETCKIEELKPQSPYAEYKIKAEQMLQEMGKNQKLKSVVCRFGTIFGTSIGMRFHTAVNKFCWQAVMGQPITIWKTAMDQKRPYLGVGDAVELIKFIIDHDLFDGEVYNIVSSNNTVRSIVETIRESVSILEVKLVDSEIMNQLSYEVLCQKILSKGYKPINDIRIGIRETLDLLSNN